MNPQADPESFERRTWVRHILGICMIVGLALASLSGHPKRSFGHDDVFWPQPFDLRPDAATTRKVSAVPCPPAVDEYVDRLRCVELQADAEAIEMMLFIVYLPHLNPEAVLSKQTADEGREAILAIRRDAEAIPAPSACLEVRLAFLNALDKVASLYDGIHQKSRAAIQKETQKCQDAVRHYRSLAAALQPLPELIRPVPFPPVPDKYLRNINDVYNQPRQPLPEMTEKFGKLLEAGVPDDSPEMNEVMDKMYPELKPRPWDGKTFKIPGCFDNDDIRQPPYGVNQYQMLWILLGGDYHPFIYEAFVTWRGRTQFEDFGISNFSQIPNLDYNQVRLGALKTLQAQLRRHPEDNWARLQKAALLAEPNIGRGGMFGNGVQANEARLKELFVRPDPNDPPPPEE